jgi:hypothetical protein
MVPNQGCREGVEQPQTSTAAEVTAVVWGLELSC